MKRKALFLDRDGVMNVDFGYVHQPERCVFIAGIFDLVCLANETGYAVIVVTNQAGIGRGYYSEAQFASFMQWMSDRFVKEGATIDRVYHCPHHPDAALGAYRKSCLCRKPSPGMFDAARQDLDLDMPASILIGDKRSDMEAGRRAGVGHCFLFGSKEKSEVPNGALAIDALLEVTPLLKAKPAIIQA
ncbi:D-glycero-alpha-D-manno-heptose-1,7-bisphosphate 7-phosphatase [Caballeronia telluris]|uniref:D,D-heptose 1,7-bisphosphate phosphatase n=1 Tax=Caballeronia telluris TaxID=326475 RepID=A0A158GLI4_9BURK|nr:HAD family hydrolase [Caballeronia telluris]SAL32681.1 D-glycero-d-manno-heptose 1,7-bisphosphate phosphatase [Caballeronia telluris]